ncbi:MAG: TonB family protein [Candidatus Omnitrophica bacterium]|nr:TonB family protein [Candidatus Omnitrophota bacterium]
MGRNSDLFQITFLVSLVVHAVLFLPMPEIKKSKQKEINQLDLNYLTLEIPAKKRVARFKRKKINNKQIALTKQLTKELAQNSVIKKQDIKITNPQAVKNLSNQGNDIIKLEQKQQIVTAADEPEKKELCKNKSYISYYRLINEQLRQAVIYPTRFTEGEIALSFVLDSDGKLKNVEVMETASLENEILKETAVQIVKRASPFPPFPKNLQHKQLTFNIVFCFKENS